MNNNSINNKLILYINLILTVCLVYISKYIQIQSYTSFLFIYAIVQLVYFIIFFYKSPVIVVILIFILTYFIYLIPHFFFQEYYFSSNRIFQSSYTISLNLKLLIVFNTFCFTALGKKIEIYKLSLEKKFNRKNAPVIVYILSIIIIFFCGLIVYEAGGTILTGGYSDTTTVGRSGFVDYSLFIIPIMFYFDKKGSQKKYILFIGILYIIVNFLFGYRLRSMQMMFALYCLYYSMKISTKKVIAICLFAIVIFAWLGSIRAGNTFSLFQVIGNFNGKDTIISNQGGVWQSSIIYISLIEYGYLDWIGRIKMLLGNIIAIVIPSTQMSPNWSIQQFVRQYVNIPGGGFASAYLYVYGGWVGVGLGGWLIGSIMSIPYREIKRQGVMLYSSLILIVTFRWYSYSLINFFKMGFWMLLLFWVCNLMYYSIANRSCDLKKLI
ncbi:MAG: O-antigen polysaccharide polymerase Wzy [Actinomycetia bacterium]|nr:O-antigen polysaccharide polymerase Wzy [Actinomycetes bacterium]